MSFRTQTLFFFPNSYPLFHTIIFLLLMFCSHAYCLMVAMWLLQFLMSWPHLSVPNVKEEGDGWKVSIPLSGRESFFQQTFPYISLAKAWSHDHLWLQSYMDYMANEKNELV